MRRNLLFALPVAAVALAVAGCGGSSGPKIVTFTGPSAVSCVGTETKSVGFKYETKNATAVEPSVDGQAIGAQAGYDPSSGTMNFPYICPGPHTVTITAFGKNNKSASKSAKLEPSSGG